MRLDTRRFNKKTIKRLRRYFFVSGRRLTHGTPPTILTPFPSHERTPRVRETQRRPDPRVTTKGRDRRYALYQGKSRHT